MFKNFARGQDMTAGTDIVTGEAEGAMEKKANQIVSKITQKRIRSARTKFKIIVGLYQILNQARCRWSLAVII